MLAQVHFPDTILPEELDRYLADGWFRMGQTVFTTNFLNFKHQFYSAIWLRIALTELGEDPDFKKLSRQNACFRTVIQKAVVTEEKEALFRRYRSSVSFEASASVQQLLFSRADGNIFDTWEVLLYDGDRLIGCGFYDFGKTAAAGITSFYDPDYKRFSLGRYLIMLKIKNCHENGLRFFYPGYFVPGYRAFDYKLKIKREALYALDLSTNQWLPITSFHENLNPLSQMLLKLNELKQAFLKFNIETQILHYEFFDAALVPELSHLVLFDFPVFLHYYDVTQERINALIVFDVRDQQYHWNFMKSLWASKLQSVKEDHYASHLLEVDLLWCSTPSADKMVEFFLDYKVKSESVS